MPNWYEYDEDMDIDGVKIYPNQTNLNFYANGHNDKSAFLKTYIAKCENNTSKNERFKNISFRNTVCAPPYEIDEYIDKLEIDFYYEF